MARLPSKLITVALAMVTLFWPSSAESPVRAASGLEPAPIRIERRLIHVPTLRPHPPRPRFAPAATRLAADTKRSGPLRKAEGLVVRASRMLVGDGRYRPEPFPRPGR